MSSERATDGRSGGHQIGSLAGWQMVRTKINMFSSYHDGYIGHISEHKKYIYSCKAAGKLD
jgi:queuine/archaeosine tRNA-ribosyltransferase